MVNVAFSNRPQHVLNYVLSTSNNNGSTIDITWTARVNTSGNINTPWGTGSASHSTSPSTTYVGGQSNATWSVPYDYRSPNQNYDFEVGSGTRRVSLGSATRTFSITVSLGSLIGSATASISYTPPAPPVTTVSVPSITGNTESDGLYILSVSGLTGSFGGYTDTYDTSYIGQSIISSQSPSAGTTVNSGSAVTYYVYRYVTPPPSAPTGLSIYSTTASSLGLSWSAVSGATEYNVYINGSYRATTTSSSYNFTGLSAATTYTLGVNATNNTGTSSLSTISGTTASINFTTPNIVGQSRSVATSILSNAGFGSVSSTAVTSGATSSNNLLAISQSPAAGSTATAGSAASFTYYDYKTAVPNIVGLTESQANSALSSSGFNSRSSSLTISGATASNNLKVASQNPTAGTQYNPSETVTFTVYNFLTSVPNVVGQALDTAITNLSSLGFTSITTTLDEVGATQDNVGKVKSQTPVNSGTTYNPASTSVNLTIYSLGVTGKRFNGTTFVALSNSKRFNGTAWQATTVAKRFNGTSWIDVTN